MDAVGPVCWKDMDSEDEVGEVPEMAGVAELVSTMVDISSPKQKSPEQVDEDGAGLLELPEVIGRLLELEVGLEGTISYIPSARSPPQASLDSPVHGTKHWLVGS